MFDHVLLTVRELERSFAFYQRVLAPLGHHRQVRYAGHAGHAALAGLGDDHERYLLLRQGTPHPRAAHLAFVAPSQRAVRAFYAAALEAGGDGYNLEAVHQLR